MRTFIYIILGTLLGSFIYFFIIGLYFNKNDYSKIVVMKDIDDEDEDEDEINRLIIHNNKISVKLTLDEIDASGIVYKNLIKEKINIQFNKSAYSIDPKDLYSLVDKFNLLTLNVNKEKIHKNYLNSNYKRLKDLYENQGSIALKDLEKSEFLKITSETEIDILSQKIKTIKNKINNIYGKHLLKDILGKRAIFNSLKKNKGALIIVDNIDLNNNNNYYYGNKNLIFLTLYNNPSFFTGNVGLFYAGSASLSANRKLSVIYKDEKYIEGYYIPENALLYHNGKIWAYFLEEELIFSRYEISNFHKSTKNAVFISDKLNNLNVVISGSQVLLAEEFRSQIMREDDD